MQVEIVPPLGERERRAVGHALAGLGVRLDGLPPAYLSPWRHTAAREAISSEPEEERYALSPRSTRGATRA